MNKIIKKLFGIDKIEEETRKAVEDAERATRIAKEAHEQANRPKKQNVLLN